MEQTTSVDDVVWAGWIHELLGPGISEDVLRRARRGGFSPTDADDIVQETLWTAYTCLLEGRYDPSRGSLGSWVAGIARNTMHRARRSRRRHAQLLHAGDELVESLVAPRDAASQRIRREWVRTRVGRGLRRLRREMSGQSFAVYVAVTLRGERAGAVAARFGLRRTTVYNIKSRGHRRLRELVVT